MNVYVGLCFYHAVFMSVSALLYATAGVMVVCSVIKGLYTVYNLSVRFWRDLSADAYQSDR